MKQLNPLYTQEETLQQIKESFASSTPNILHLPHFLTMQIYESLLKQCASAKEVHKKVADRYSYTELKEIPASMLQSAEFISWLSSITGRKIKKISYTLKKFSHCDYTLLHDSETIGERLEFFILLMPNWDSRWGGHTVYVAEEQSPILFPLEGNSFNLINKEKNRHKFIQYINHYAKKEKMVIIEGIAE
ncbi:MAG: hypothetical protein AABY00_03860 [Nanoarchaeota archaeon]